MPARATSGHSHRARGCPLLEASSTGRRNTLSLREKIDYRPTSQRFYGGTRAAEKIALWDSWLRRGSLKAIGRALSQLLRSGRGEADPVPESGAATAPNRKSLKWNQRRPRRRPHHRASSSRCAAQAARADRADSAPPKASFAAPDSSAPTRQGIKSASAPAEKSGERARRSATAPPATSP